VKAPANIYAFFGKTAGKQLVLKVNNEPDLKTARSITVVPIRNESRLRHKDWIESNRKKIAKLSDGKVGYVYMPDTANGGFTYFNRYYFSQLNRQGIIIDERYNSGGLVADYVVNMLDRKLLNWWLPRYGKPFATPGAANFGSKVMIIDEMAGSGGDYMPFAFRERGIGKLVGKRTWGGLVGISGYPRLMDGGFVTAPSFAYVDLNGEFTIENEGVTPDIEVDITPADYKAGKDSQLLKALEVVMKEIAEKKLPKFKPKSFPRGR
jgi:tricorn protease